VPKRILIVDDSGPVRAGTRHFLERQPGFEVCGEAVDGLDALEKTHYLNPDLIVMDLQMPRMNGLQAARELRARMVRAHIVLFTMYADELLPQEVSAAGVSAVVRKPNLSALRKNIESLGQLA
jgi:DNA-binding NarL/FixJ family response regulator